MHVTLMPILERDKVKGYSFSYKVLIIFIRKRIHVVLCFKLTLKSNLKRKKGRFFQECKGIIFQGHSHRRHASFSPALPQGLCGRIRVGSFVSTDCGVFLDSNRGACWVWSGGKAVCQWACPSLVHGCSRLLRPAQLPALPAHLLTTLHPAG